VRDRPRDPHRGLLVDLTGTFFPAVWDVTSEFSAIAAGATAYLTFPIPIHPVVMLRGGGKKLYGDFPFYEAAFIGSRNTLRTLEAQRYAGDASLWGTAELRLPLKFAFILPWSVGMFGFVDAGRVYVNGDSPGGWHTGAGIGAWIGVPDPTSAVKVCRRPSGGGFC
jgi:outer membrane protein assembly factor BamA